MEENQSETQTQPVQEVSEQPAQNPSSGVSFPTVGQSKKSGGGGKTLLTLGILALVGVLGYFIYRSAAGGSALETPTPAPTVEAMQTVEPEESTAPVDKTKVKIEVQNGTGITGEAAFLQTQLKNLGYSTISVGNASSQDNTTTVVTFSKSLSTSVVDEITKKLKELYKEVDTKTSSSTSIDVLVVTGLKKGATAKPEATATAKPSSTPTASASSSPTASPTATP